MLDFATSTASQSRRDARLFYMHPLQAGRLADWPALLGEAASLRFSHVVLPAPFLSADVRLLDDPSHPHPDLAFNGDAAGLLAAITAMCRNAGIGWMLDIRLDAVARDGRLQREHPDLFDAPGPWAAINPTKANPVARLRGDAARSRIAEFWAAWLERWGAAGASGFRLNGLSALAPETLAALIGQHRRSGGAQTLIGALDGVATEALGLWDNVGLDRTELALDRWEDGTSSLVLKRAAALSEVAPVIVSLERPFGPRFAASFSNRATWSAAARRLLIFASALSGELMMPAGFAGGETLRMDPGYRSPALTGGLIPPSIAASIREANTEVCGPGVPLPLPSPSAGVDGVFRRSETGAKVTLISRAPAPRSIHAAGILKGYLCETERTITLAGGEAKTIDLVPAKMIQLTRPARSATATESAASGRVGIEAVAPAVDDGRFAVKRVVGDVVAVECDVICDGHDQLAAVVQFRAINETTWREARMVPLGNDRWQASFELTAIGRWVFRVVAWRDVFATFRDELTKKNAAGLNVSLEVQEGRLLVEGAKVAQTLDALDAATTVTERVDILLSDAVAAAMQAADSRVFLTQTQDFPVDADRLQAACAAWYEIFPRSMSGDGVRHGTFRDVITQLPRIRAMGFDVLYFPPIHPIGRTNRKGRNNSLTPAADDPGSPYAIGSSDGGHDALHPELGSFDDFEAMRLAAKDAGLEIAIDFAIQCAPDHPWLTEHKGWFDWRPDGSLRYAENPPKKYEDIVNVDFYAPDAVPGLWVALADVVFFWLERGVRIFRVDNPHTKPLPFWEWLIFEVRCAYPDAIFLAEAFTRPKVMNRLGKIGFHQSYTYFTWRNAKLELQDYLTQLTTTASRDFFRPNFFVNTPDINPVFLQNSGRAGFLIRAALAATLSGSWGVYCGFELCEGTPVPGKEDYLDSEKYQLRAWDWERPGNIVAEIAQLNAVRRMHPSLWSHLGVTFLPSDDDQVMFLEKATPDRSDVMLIAICLDPFNTHTAAIELPLWRWGLSDRASLDCRDVLHDTQFTLSGKWQRVALSPNSPYTIWHAHPQGPYSA